MVSGRTPQCGPNHLDGHALEPRFPILGQRGIELGKGGLAEPLRLPVAQIVETVGGVVGQKGQTSIDAAQLLLKFARVFVEDVEPVQQLVGKQPVCILLGHGRQGPGPGDHLGHIRIFQGGHQIIAEGLRLHRVRQRL